MTIVTMKWVKVYFPCNVFDAFIEDIHKVYPLANYDVESQSLEFQWFK